MSQSPEQTKIHVDLSNKLGISVAKVEQAIDLFHSCIAEKIQNAEPFEVIIPYLGKIKADKTIIKQFNENNEVNNIGGGESCIQS